MDCEYYDQRHAMKKNWKQANDPEMNIIKMHRVAAAQRHKKQEEV